MKVKRNILLFAWLVTGLVFDRNYGGQYLPRHSSE